MIVEAKNNLFYHGNLVPRGTQLDVSDEESKIMLGVKAIRPSPDHFDVLLTAVGRASEGKSVNTNPIPGALIEEYAKLQDVAVDGRPKADIFNDIVKKAKEAAAEAGNKQTEA